MPVALATLSLCLFIKRICTKTRGQEMWQGVKGAQTDKMRGWILQTLLFSFPSRPGFVLLL